MEPPFLYVKNIVSDILIKVHDGFRNLFLAKSVKFFVLGLWLIATAYPVNMYNRNSLFQNKLNLMKKPTNERPFVYA